MPLAIGSDSKPRLRAAALEGAEEVEGLAVSADEKSTPVSAMIPLLPRVGGEDAAKLARLIRSLGGKGAMERASDTVEELDDENLEIVVREIPESGRLKKAMEARRAASAEE